ncbi:MAG: hypothetical protein HGA85_01345, partial [Nanoarchaeota archaeon]|nr:hypothetical protein [Nanoarchaeota archaeon]
MSMIYPAYQSMIAKYKAIPTFSGSEKGQLEKFLGGFVAEMLDFGIAQLSVAEANRPEFPEEKGRQFYKEFKQITDNISARLYGSAEHGSLTKRYERGGIFDIYSPCENSILNSDYLELGITQRRMEENRPLDQAESLALYKNMRNLKVPALVQMVIQELDRRRLDPLWSFYPEGDVMRGEDDAYSLRLHVNFEDKKSEPEVTFNVELSDCWVPK